MEILESVGVYQGLLQNTNAICPGWTLFKLRRQGVKRDCCVKSNSRNDLLDLHLLNPRHWNSQQHQRRSSPVWQYMLESSFYADQKQAYEKLFLREELLSDIFNIPPLLLELR